MQQFDATRPCPKCGNNGNATTRYYHAEGDCDMESAEHIHRICNACHYGWAEAPQDQE